MAEEKEIFKYGVKKEIIQERIAEYEAIVNGDLTEKGDPRLALGVLVTQFQQLIDQEEIAVGDPDREQKLATLNQKKQEIINRQKEIEEESADFLYAGDVVDEVKDLLAKSKDEYGFVEVEDIQERIEMYKKMLNNLDMDYLKNRKIELEKELKKLRENLEKLKEEVKKKGGELSKGTPSKEFLDKAREEAIEELKGHIANREAMIVGRGGELSQNRYDELAEWKKQLADLEAGNVTEDIIVTARNLEMNDLKNRIANREAMIVGRGDELSQNRYDELEVWKKRLSELQEQEKTGSTKNDEMSELEKNISEKQRELVEIEKKITELDGRNPIDVQNQRRGIQNRITELEDLERQKSLFRITDKGEIEITYPEVPLEIDKDAILKEYEYRRTDMLDKYYGNREKGKEYKEKIKEFKSHIIEKEFEFVDEDGKTQKGVYKTIEDYEGMEEDVKFLQLEEYKERLERTTRADAGDKSVYKKFKYPELAEQSDREYIETNNSSYNRAVATRDNLRTLGKYGEKVPYNKMQEGQPVRNALRGVGNVLKFGRNHITAPINKFVGTYIVAPIYGGIAGSNRGNVAGLYANKTSHRYVARRDYFASQGKGYFSSRFNAIFNAKEGNKAILSAGAYDIQRSIKTKYTDMAVKEAKQKQIEFASKSIDGQIDMIKTDMERATDPAAKEKYQKTLELLERAKKQIEVDRQKAENMRVRATRQTDAVDMDQHDVANKENVTRTITGIKMIARFGIKKFVGPKIKEWIKDHTKQPDDTSPSLDDAATPTDATPTTDPVASSDPYWIDDTYKSVPETATRYTNSSTLQEVMASNAGKEVTGFYSVYGGEAKAATYTLTGNEKITAIFQSIDGKGVGLSDKSGLTAPVFTNGVFDASALDASGVLSQGLTIDQIVDAVKTGTIDASTYQDLYVSVGDKFWVRLGDLTQATLEEYKTGNMIDVVDVAGHWASDSEKIALGLVEAAENVATTSDATEEIAEAAEAVVNMVDNPAVTKGLDVASRVYDGASVVGFADDIYENVRKTGTDVRQTKPQPRRTEYDAGFTGRKADDYKVEMEELEIDDEQSLAGGLIIKDNLKQKQTKEEHGDGER